MAARSNFLIPRGAKSSGQESHSKQLVLHGTTAKITQPHPSTSRALVLRKAAYGSGEVALSRKVSGQEKLSLLAGGWECRLCCSGRFDVLCLKMR